MLETEDKDIHLQEERGLPFPLATPYLVIFGAEPFQGLQISVLK